MRAPDPARIEDALRAFDAAVKPALFAAAAASEDCAREAIDRIRHKLDQLDALLAPTAHSANAASPSGPETGGALSTDLETLGRNQRAKLRELALLDVLAAEGQPMTTTAIVAQLLKHGFDDELATVTSQLHRLKKMDIVELLGPGMFQLTKSGREHLHQLKATIGKIGRG